MKRLILALTLLALAAACDSGGAVVTADLPGTGGSDSQVEDTVVDLVSPDDLGPRAEIFGDAKDIGEPDAPACETGNGCSGDPCTESSDCLSGICVDHMGDSVCSQTCVEECPNGFVCKEVSVGGPDSAWVCVSNFPRLCRPCTTDDDCLSATGQESRCIPYADQGSFCGGSCGTDEDCPLGFTCDETETLDGVAIKQCLNSSGVCPCSDQAISLALSTPCSQENEIGTCHGLRFCSQTGLTECDAALPAEESCNGLDDDCDGETDEDTCDDGNDCTTDGCAPDLGCVHENLTGDDCDDGDDCTLGDSCSNGVCAGESVSCNDGNPCTTDTCDPNTGCKFAPYDGPCDDGDPCTYGDFCQEQSCQSGVKVNCDDSNPCTDDSCDAENGCLHEPTSGDCDDDNPCTLNDTCQAGKCVASGLLDCDDDNPCTNDWCDPNKGCQHVPNQAACDDGSLCTLGDHCDNGDCVAGTQLNCDDSNPCTNDTCNPLLGCKHTNNTAACDDQDPCTASDACVGGSCVGTGAIDCDDANPCTTDFCDPMAGCTHVPGTGSCDDANPCSFGDKCQAGKCVGGQPVSCDDGNVCTDDACDPSVGCVHTANAESCDDQNACTTDDHCSMGQCVSNQAVACDDSNPCTTDICLPQGGCQFVPNNAPCDDGDACTTGDQCADSACQSGAPVQCNDGNVCTADSCQAGICKFVPTDGGCDDNNPCTLNDQCGNGWCQPGVALNCDDDNLCTNDTCSPQTGCVHTLNMVPCDDGDACTLGDVCSLGECQSGAVLNCDDANACTVSTCDSGQCIHAPVDGVCDDGNACTGGDHCSAGLCVPEAIVSCSDDNPCTADSCHPLNGCQHVPEDGICDDGNACTPDDACLDGACVGSGALDCDDGNQCTTDTCDLAEGCLHAAISPCCGNGQTEAGEECDDGNLVPGDGCDESCQSESINTPECTQYSVLNNYDRNVTQNDGNGGVETCDGNMGSKWYRFEGAAGTKMPNSCPPIYSCGTDAPGWMNGSYPSVNDGIVNRTVCFHWDGNCCRWSTGIQVRNCKDYYVFKLGSTPECTLRFCGTN